MSRRWTVAELNAMERAEFVRVVGPVFEGPPWIAEGTWPRRPFATAEELHRELCETMQQAGEARQVQLIQAHPDLVGQAALAGTLTRASTEEQASAGLDRLSSQDIARFQELNAAYQQRFGFPFVICARDNKKDAILAAFPERVGHARATEIAVALREIGRIARLRLDDLIHG